MFQDKTVVAMNECDLHIGEIFFTIISFQQPVLDTEHNRVADATVIYTLSLGF